MTELLENLIDHPESSVRGPQSDLLSHVLAQIRLTGDCVYARSLAQAEPLELDIDAAHVCIVMQGTLHMESDDPITGALDAGDVGLLPRSAGDLRLVAGAPTTVVVCRFWFDPDSLRSMIFALPRCIHIRKADGANRLDGIVHFLLSEAKDVQPGATLMISRMIDLVVIRVLRSWIHQGQTSGWLGGLSDARIARALKAIHEEPLKRWSIEALANIAGMSRSSFCARFTALVGRSPLRYHSEWRLGLARDMLAKRSARVGEIGLSIGYASEAAFSRAYKALFGHSPRAGYLTAPPPS
ncbi:AraC family transcriptional regulator [Elstera litoralis]|uniref:AraC family transcriptional regulator n=1 Tax=Elstera litoralis TaxID=552518 RepID=A0A0F3IPI7_9PROT|nr:AraC family transcriptional regulator [Elstera litoralis]KJV08468.1 AraC family transcriptional regulator [Elstera litoralis]